MKYVLQLPLYPLAWLFGALVWLKNRYYDSGLGREQHLPRPVISVGNLSMGGAGKSPVVGALIKLLTARGLRVAVLSRGYGRRNPKDCLRVEPRGDWRDYGDEPTMLARAYPQAEILVGPSRYAAAQLTAHDRPDIFVVDDGFQHRRLARDLDIVLLDVAQGLPRLFPLGLFRESLSALRRAHLVLLTRTQADTSRDWETSIAAVNPHIPVLRPHFTTRRLKRLGDGENLEPTQLPSNRVAAFAGIARPEKFYKSLEELGLEVVFSHSLGDHEALGGARLSALLERCRREAVGTLITTEKDAVKLEIGANSDILLCSLSLEVSFDEEDEINAVLDGLIKADS